MDYSNTNTRRIGQTNARTTSGGRLVAMDTNIALQGIAPKAIIVTH